MNVKSVSGFTVYVKNLDKTVEFYTVLGFDFRVKDEHRAVGYKNWYSINFVAADKEDKQEFLKEANADNKGAGMYINLSVEDVDGAYKEKQIK
jgi:catechol 2,3-dioxygenase-like lactoylglutathione lyase family enzyme